MPDPDEQAASRHPLSILGAALSVVSAVLFLTFFVLDLVGFETNPYFGIVTFLLLPAVFLIGLVLVPLGMWMTRRRTAQGRPAAAWPVIDLRRASVRRTAAFIVVLTCVNAAILAMASYKSVEYVDSTDFCTGVCHTPMQPEATAHRASVHASIACTSCHVGPGAPGFVRAKTGGVRRVAAVVTDSYERPIPSPPHDLPGAVGTCRNCHTPTKFFGDLVRQFPYYSDDEEVTEQVTTMVMHVGGGGSDVVPPRGIHWHASPATRIEYIATDAGRDTIPWLRVSDAAGVREYADEGVTPEQIVGGVRRVMDCTDCHNRIGHPFAGSPERAVDGALAQRLLPRTLPFMRREAVAALGADYPDRATAVQQIATHLTAFYAEQAGGTNDDGRVAQAVRATQDLYTGNVFPAMNVSWGSYPTNIGHTDAPGCFRCHDETKRTNTGLVISQDCEMCHRMP
jgi:hypothetical protein